MSSLPVAVVVGASRGIGLQLAKALRETHEVYATCRTGNNSLEQLTTSRFHVVPDVDVGEDGGCDGLRATVAVAKVDLLVCNAGVFANDTLDDLDFAVMRQMFNVNSLGPLRVVQALRPKLQDGCKLVLIGSKMGSLTNSADKGTRYGYKMSKAALHMAGVVMAADLKAAGVAVAMIHPGVVETDMTQISKSVTQFTAEESACSVLKAAAAVNLSNTGRLWNYDGTELPW